MMFTEARTCPIKDIVHVFAARIPMLSITLQRADHVRQYSIHPMAGAGWVVRLEEDQTLTRHACYHDWHRVERTLAMFRQEVAELMEHGWELRSATS